LTVLQLLACLHQPTTGDALPASVDLVAALRELDGHAYLVGQDSAEPTGEWTMLGSSPDTWRAPTDAVDERRPVGSRWTVGDQRCVVEGYDLVVEEYVETWYTPEGEPTGEPTGPGCGQPALWARLRCDGPLTATLAVPEGVRPPVEVESFTPLAEAALVPFAAAIRALPRFSENRADAESQAGERGTAVTEQIEARRYETGAASWILVDASVWSGDGMNYCGGDDVFHRGLVVLSADGRVLTELWVDDYTEITGLFDVENDGVPEIGVASWGEESLWSAGGSTPIHAVASCVCGC
jgi:hypothetical protein